MKFDSIIIGFGKAGKTLAGVLANNGEKIALIEKSKEMYGGTCINVGCIPSKSLVTSGLTKKYCGEISFEEKAKNYKLAIGEKHNLTSKLRTKNYEKLANLKNITIFDGEGSFLSNKIIKIKRKSDSIEIEGDKIFINTGSTPRIPNISGIRDNPYVYFSENLMNLDKLPKTLVIIGGGYIGLEFASIYTNFGSKVTVLNHSEKFLKREDEDIANEIQLVMEKQGVSFEFGTEIESINKDESKKLATVNFTQGGSSNSIESEAVLLATGRKPNIDNLNLSFAGVETNSRGAIAVDKFRKTNVDNIWAMGDVVGELQFTYVSLDDYRIISSQLFGDGSYDGSKRKNIPYSVFISPSFSRVGLNEKEAISKGYNIKIAKLPAAAIPKANVLKKPEGLLKAIVDKNNNKILGAMLFCEESYELINLIKLAMDLNIDYNIIKNQIFTHPTMSESLNDLFSTI